MARVLIVGCGCRGRQLGRALSERGHAVRGTSRSEDGRAAIAAAGLEGVVADPARLATLTPQLQGVSVLCWLMATAPDAALRGDRFASLLETLVDTHVRGVVHEAAAEAPAAERARVTYLMPIATVAEPPGDHERWLAAALAAVDEVLSA
jgi:nucleoside-diphosphate-sugar epimerase